MCRITYVVTLSLNSIKFVVKAIINETIGKAY